MARWGSRMGFRALRDGVARVWSRRGFVSLWVVAIPALLDLFRRVLLEGALSTSTVLYVLSYLLVAVLVVTPLRLLPLPVWGIIRLFAPVLFLLLAAAHQGILWLLEGALAGADVTPFDWMESLRVWVVGGLVGWAIAGLIESGARRRDASQTLERAFSTILAFQESRIQILLRSLVHDLGRHIDRVFIDLTSRSHSSPEPRVRALPHHDREVVDPLAHAVARSWLGRDSATDTHTPNRLGLHVAAGHPLVFLLGVAAMSVIGTSVQLSWIHGVALLVGAALLVLGGGLVRQQHGPVLRALLSLLVSTVAVTSTLAISVFDGPLSGAWVWSVISAGIFSIVVGTWLLTLHEQSKRLMQSVREKASRCDSYSAKLNVLESVNPRLLYSATLGTLISATVDLTDGASSDDTKQRATETIASRIVAEFGARELSAQPLPPDHLRATVATWDAVIGSHTSISPEVFRDVLWTTELVEEFSQTWAVIASTLVEKAEGPIALSLERHDGGFALSCEYRGEPVRANDIRAEEKVVVAPTGIDPVAFLVSI